MWFAIRKHHRLENGPEHLLSSIQLLNKHAPQSVVNIVKPVIERGSWHGHSENILLSLLTQKDIAMRKFAVEKILNNRNKPAPSKLRDFHVPKINWDATSIKDLISWDTVHEPVLTS